MSWLEEFQKAYDDVPSQDNEGYVPERGSFKTGFSRAWHLQQQNIYARDQSLKEAREEIEGLKRKIDKADKTLEFIREESHQFLKVTEIASHENAVALRVWGEAVSARAAIREGQK